MDLSRSVETIIFPNRKVLSADYSPDASFVIFSAIAPQTTEEDLFYSQPNGQAEENLTQSLTVRERNPRVDPFARTAVFERIDESALAASTSTRAHALTGGRPTGPAPRNALRRGGRRRPHAASPTPWWSSSADRHRTAALARPDLLTLRADGVVKPVVIATGPLYRGAPDWGSRGILFVETDAAISRSQLVLVQPDGSGRTVLRTEDAGSRMGAPRWLPGS
jgi:hypothetical protein